MRLCTRESICDHILEVYIDKAEELNAGVLDRTIEAVSGEIIDMLAYYYPQPWPAVPNLVAYIAAVTAAYRTITAITTIVDTEGSTENEWLPLQRKMDRCEKLLDSLAANKIKLPFEDDLRDREDPTVAVIAGKRRINMRGF